MNYLAQTQNSKKTEDWVDQRAPRSHIFQMQYTYDPYLAHGPYYRHILRMKHHLETC